MSFPIHDRQVENFPSFNKPEIIGYFSLNGTSREYSQDLSQLKYYNDRGDRQVHFDLDEGIHKVIRKPNGLNERIDHLLRWILNNNAKIRAAPEQRRWLKPEFVCFRGLLTRICCTPFESRDAWILCAAKFQGTIYLCEFDTADKKKRIANLSNKDLQFMSWGFKFEQYVLSESPDCVPNTKEAVNEAEEFCCLFSSKLGQNYLLFGAEMDGVCSKEIVTEPVDWKVLKLVELKTNKVVRNSWQEDNYKKKLLKWWCQSFLVGIEKVVCGNRTEQGVVFELKDIKVSDMPKVAKDFWSASVCMNFCNNFLNHVKTVVKEDYNKCIYKFEYKFGDKIEMQILSSQSEYSFLPDWYIKQLSQLIKNNID